MVAPTLGFASSEHAPIDPSGHHGYEVLAFSEENLPPEDLPANGQAPPSPSAASPLASPSASGAPGEWTEVPNPNGSQDSADTGAADSTTGADDTGSDTGAADATENPDAGNRSTPAVSSTPSAEPSPSGVTAGPTAPGASVASSGPPVDLDNAIAGQQLSDASLAPEIQAAATPALAASLHLTDQARADLDGGRADAAIRELGRAITVDPNNPYGYFYLGRAYLSQKDYQQALTFFRHATVGFGSNPPWLAEALSFEGVCFEELGRFDEAQAAYQRALAANPNDQIARGGYQRMGPASNASVDASAGAPPAPGDEAAPPPPADSDIEPAPDEPPPLPATGNSSPEDDPGQAGDSPAN